MENEQITIAFNIMGEITSYPIKVNKDGTVLDLITQCSKVCGIQVDDLNIRDVQRNFVRSANLSYYRVKEGDIIIGAKKYVYDPSQIKPQKDQDGDSIRKSNEEEDEGDVKDEGEDEENEILD